MFSSVRNYSATQERRAQSSCRVRGAGSDCGRARNRFGPVHVLDPFGVTGARPFCFNPLTALDPDSPDLAEDVAALAYDASGECAR